MKADAKRSSLSESPAPKGAQKKTPSEGKQGAPRDPDGAGTAWARAKDERQRIRSEPHAKAVEERQRRAPSEECKVRWRKHEPGHDTRPTTEHGMAIANTV